MRNSLRPQPLVLLALMALASCNGQSTGVTQIPAQPQRVGNAASQALLYVSDPVNDVVHMYAYPQLKPAGDITSVRNPTGLCVDRKTGNVWVVDDIDSEVVEFAHGGTTPIATVHEAAAQYADACAVDPRTGDLAVAIVDWQGSDPGSVAIFKHAQGQPSIYSDRRLYIFAFIAYDPAGDIFIDATGLRRPVFRFAELAKGRSKFNILKLSGAHIRVPGGIQYTGKNSFAIADAQRAIIYQTSNGVVTGRTHLENHACRLNQFLIQDGHVIAAVSCGSTNGNLLIYNYPAGGAPIKKLAVSVPFGVAISR
jgi:hypothetical protein